MKNYQVIIQLSIDDDSQAHSDQSIREKIVSDYLHQIISKDLGNNDGINIGKVEAREVNEGSI